MAPETGMTYDALKEPIPNEEGILLENKGVYVADVVKEPRIMYHRWPKLGAFYAVPMIFNSSLQESSLDVAVEQRLIFLKAKDEQKREREAKELEYEDQIQAKIDAAEDITHLEQELQTYRVQPNELKEPPF